MDKFTPENPENKIIKRQPVINWNHFNRIILILIFFTYFNQITRETFDFIKLGYKFVILLIVLEVFFKEFPLIEKIKELILYLKNVVKKIIYN